MPGKSGRGQTSRHLRSERLDDANGNHSRVRLVLATRPREGGRLLTEPISAELDRWQRKERLDGGEWGETWTAEDPQAPGERRILKLSPAEIPYDPDRVRGFLDVMRTLGELQLPAVVRPIAFGEHEGRAFLLRPCVEGNTLQERVEAEQGSVRADRFVRFFRGLLEVLEIAHSHGLVHGGLSPRNLLIDRQNRLWVTDFQWAAAWRAPERQARDAYHAPEDTPPAVCTVRGDVYSVGKILEEVLQRSTGDEGLIRRLEQVARRATGAPEQRYASASAMAQDIPAVNETGDGAAQGSSRGTDARLRIAFGVLLLGIVVLLAVGYFGGWFVRKGDGDGRAEARDPASPKRGLPEARERMEARDWRSAEQILEPLEGDGEAKRALDELFLSRVRAFVQIEREDGPEIAQIDPRGSLMRRARGRNAAVSPDGTRLAVGMVRDGTPAIALIEEAGGEPRVIDGQGGYCDYPSWSPDSKRLAFVWGRGSRTELRLLESAGGDVRTLADGAAPETASWRTGGKRLTFATTEEGGWDLACVDLDRPGIERWTRDAAREIFPSFSPEGSRVAFVADEEGVRTLKILSTRDRSVKSVVLDDAPGGRPMWSSDGSSILVRVERYEDSDFVLVSGPSWNVSRIAPEGVTIAAACWAGAEGQILYLSFEDGEPVLNRLPRPGAVPRRLRTISLPRETVSLVCSSPLP